MADILIYVAGIFTGFAISFVMAISYLAGRDTALRETKRGRTSDPQ